MPNPTYTLFDGLNKCLEGLPVNPEIDEITIAQFIAIIEDDSGTEVGIPNSVAMPAAIGAALGKIPAKYHRAVADALRGASPLIDSWRKVPVEAMVSAPVQIGDLETLVQSGRFHANKLEYEVQLSSSQIAALAAGHTVVVRAFTADGKRLDDVPLQITKRLARGEVAKVELSPAQLGDVLARKGLFVPGIGWKELSLTSESISELLSQGVSKVRSASAGDAGHIYLATTLGGAAPAADKLLSGPMGTPPSLPPLGPIPKLLPEIPIVVYLPLRQTWTLKGYSRGTLLNTFSLAPQEELTIEVYSWDRRKTESEQSLAMENEYTSDASVTGKDVGEVMTEAQQRNGWEAGFDITVPQTPIKVNGKIDGQLTNTTKDTASHTTEAVRKASQKIKASRTTKLMHSQEIGTENRVTRRIHNPNMCHVLNLDCFETLVTYSVETVPDLQSARLCVLIPAYDHLSINDEDGLIGIESLLRDKVPTALQSGFDAARKVRAWRYLCEWKCNPPFSCPPVSSGAGSSPASTQVTVALQQVQGTIKPLQDAIDALASADLQPLCDLCNDVLGNISHPKPDSEWQAARQRAHQWLFRGAVLERTAERFWNACKNFADKGDKATASDLASLVQAADPQLLDVLNVVLSIASVPWAVISGLIDIVRKICMLAGLDLLGNLAFDDAGLETAFRKAKAAITAWQQAQKPPAANKGGEAEAGSGGANAQGDDYLLKDIAEAKVDIKVLIEHIRLHRSHYRRVIWEALDPEDRAAFFDIYGHLGRFLKPNLLGLVGNRLAVEFNLESDGGVATWFDQFIVNNENLAKVAASTEVTLPTATVAMESRLGECDACEPYIAESRAAELRRVKAVADQAEQEAARLKERNAAQLLDDPKPTVPTLTVKVEQTKQP